MRHSKPLANAWRSCGGNIVQSFTWVNELVEVLRDDWQDADENPDEIEADFRQAWHEAMTGNILPIESLWDEWENSDESEFCDS